jgi:archaellum component FlaC
VVTAPVWGAPANEIDVYKNMQKMLPLDELSFNLEKLDLQLPDAQSKVYLQLTLQTNRRVPIERSFGCSGGPPDSVNIGKLVGPVALNTAEGKAHLAKGQNVGITFRGTEVYNAIRTMKSNFNEGDSVAFKVLVYRGGWWNSLIPEKRVEATKPAVLVVSGTVQTVKKAPFIAEAVLVLYVQSEEQAAQLKTQGGQIKKLEEKTDSLNTALTNLNSVVDAQGKALADLNKQQAATVADLAQVKSKIALNEADLNALKTAIKSLKDEVDANEKVTAEFIVTAEKTVDEIEGRLDELQKRAVASEESINSLKEDLTDLKDSLAAKKGFFYRIGQGIAYPFKKIGGFFRRVF